MSNNKTPSLNEIQFRRLQEDVCRRKGRPPGPQAYAELKRPVEHQGPVGQNSEKPKSSAQVAPTVKQQAVKRGACELKLDKSKPSFIGIRFAQSEREIVVKRAEESGLTISEYVRASVLGAGYLSAIDPVKQELLQKLNRELGRQGNNLNQIAKHLNGGTATPVQGDSMLAMVTRSLLNAHRAVREALAEGKVEQ